MNAELDRDRLDQPPPGPPPPSGETRVGWGPSEAVAGVFAVFFFLLAGGLAVYAVAGDSGIDFTIGNQLVLEAAFLGTAVFFASRARPASAARALGLRRPRDAWIGPTAAAFFGYLIFAAVFASLLADPEQIDVADELGFDASTLGAISAGVLIVGVAPFAEEVFFRGFFFGGLRTRMPAWGAVIASGAFFGVIHLTTGNVAVGVQLSVLGVVLALLYERTGSLWPPIIVHLINNALAFTVLVSS